MLFKIDENLPKEAAELLRNSGHDALTLVDQQLNGQPDPNVAAVCKAEARALVTLDLDFADIRTYPPADHPGIVVMRPAVQAKAAVINLVQRLLPLLETESLSGHLWIVDEVQVRIR